MAGKDGSRSKQNRHADDDAVVTSAPAANVGNLLTDLLSSVKKDVEEERQQKVESEAQKREREAREAREREETRLRTAAQEKLIEENRLRNESLTKARADLGDSGDAVMATGQHLRPSTDAPAPAAAVKPLEVSKVGPMPSRGVSRFLAAAMVVLGVGLGFGGAFAMQPEQKAVFPDLDRAVATTVGIVSKAAAVEVSVRGELSKEAARVGELSGSVKAMQARQAELEAKVGELTAALEAAATEEEEPSKPVRRGGNRGGNRGGGLPGLSTGIY